MAARKEPWYAVHRRPRSGNPGRALRVSARLGLPDDALRFYELSDGACLHAVPDGGLLETGGRQWSWALPPSRELVPISDMGFIDEDCPLFERARRWIAVADVQDGNYLALSVESGHAGEVIDCFHETVGAPGQSAIVALSFTEMLEGLLASRDCFWLADDRPRYGAY
jgi:hypothetical protein